jgi:tetratricopeptide (TPR) repeat protein
MNRFALCLLIGMTGLFSAEQEDNTWERELLGGEEAQAKGDLATAERQLETATRLARKFGTEDPRLGKCLSSLGALRLTQRRMEDAEESFREALKIFEQTAGEKHPFVAACLNNLGQLYQLQNKYDLAERYYQRALDILKDSPRAAPVLGNLAAVHSAQKRYDEAELLLEKSVVLADRTYIAGHPAQLIAINNLASFYMSREKPNQAEPMYVRAVGLNETTNGADSLETAQALHALAVCLSAQKKVDQAESLFRKLLDLCTRKLPPEHPAHIEVLEGLARVLKMAGRDLEALPLESRAATLKKKSP